MRIANLSGTETCPFCEPGRHAQSGLAVVARLANGHDEFGPCPHCEAGAAAELAHWHGEFWQGREAEVAPRQGEGGRPLPVAENRIRMGLLLRRMDGHPTADPCFALDIRDDRQRMRMLTVHADGLPTGAAASTVPAQ